MNKSTLTTAAALIGLLVAGCSAPDNASETVHAAPAAETVTAPDEDMTLPSGIGGLTIAELHQDAAATLATIPARPASGQYTGVPEYAASYETTAPAFPVTYFTLESRTRAGIFHVFQMTAALRA